MYAPLQALINDMTAPIPPRTHPVSMGVAEGEAGANRNTQSWRFAFRENLVEDTFDVDSTYRHAAANGRCANAALELIAARIAANRYSTDQERVTGLLDCLSSITTVLREVKDDGERAAKTIRMCEDAADEAVKG